MDPPFNDQDPFAQERQEIDAMYGNTLNLFPIEDATAETDTEQPQSERAQAVPPQPNEGNTEQTEGATLPDSFLDPETWLSREWHEALGSPPGPQAWNNPSEAQPTSQSAPDMLPLDFSPPDMLPPDISFPPFTYPASTNAAPEEPAFGGDFSFDAILASTGYDAGSAPSQPAAGPDLSFEAFLGGVDWNTISATPPQLPLAGSAPSPEPDLPFDAFLGGVDWNTIRTPPPQLALAGSASSQPATGPFNAVDWNTITVRPSELALDQAGTVPTLEDFSLGSASAEAGPHAGRTLSQSSHSILGSASAEAGSQSSHSMSAISDTSSDSGSLFIPPAPRQRRRPPTWDPNKPWVKINATTEGRNLRSAKIQGFNPAEVYTPLPEIPQPWGSFAYTQHGELEANRVYSVAEIRNFLYEHPLNNLPDGQAKQFRLWVQRSPADSARRYPHQNSSRCRFHDCFGPERGIHAGHFRVTFDEQSFQNANVDPFLNAGYVHLFCLEQLMDFPQIVRDFDIRIDDRALPAEPDGINRMTLEPPRGFSSLEAAAKKFFENCRLGLPGQPPDVITKLHKKNIMFTPDGTLTQLLHAVKLYTDPPARRSRKTKDENDESRAIVTLGNLILENQARESRKQAVKQAAAARKEAAKKAAATRKRNEKAAKAKKRQRRRARDRLKTKRSAQSNKSNS